MSMSFITFLLCFFSIFVQDIWGECPPDYKCESNQQQRRIIGGDYVRDFIYPWMAILLTESDNLCGGSLITKTHILTAGHCIDNITSMNEVLVMLGVLDWCDENNPELIMRQPIAIYLHEDYHEDSENVKHNDIAVLLLEAEVDLPVICLPCAEFLPNSAAIATGWGRYDVEDMNPSCELKYTHLESQENEKFASLNRILTRGMGTEICDGDSGGPLFTTESNDRYLIRGVIVNASPFCNVTELSTQGSMDVYKYLPWIMGKIRM